jgi:hypothetical protein
MFLVPALDPTLIPALVLALDPTLIPAPQYCTKTQGELAVMALAASDGKSGTWVFFMLIPSSY